MFNINEHNNIKRGKRSKVAWYTSKGSFVFTFRCWDWARRLHHWWDTASGQWGNGQGEWRQSWNVHQQCLGDSLPVPLWQPGGKCGVFSAWNCWRRLDQYSLSDKCYRKFYWWMFYLLSSSHCLCDVWSRGWPDLPGWTGLYREWGDTDGLQHLTKQSVFLYSRWRYRSLLPKSGPLGLTVGTHACTYVHQLPTPGNENEGDDNDATPIPPKRQKEGTRPKAHRQKRPTSLRQTLLGTQLLLPTRDDQNQQMRVDMEKVKQFKGEALLLCTTGMSASTKFHDRGRCLNHYKSPLRLQTQCT